MHGLWNPPYCTIWKNTQLRFRGVGWTFPHIRWSQLQYLWLVARRVQVVLFLASISHVCISNSQALSKNCMRTCPGSYITTIGVWLVRHRYLPYSRLLKPSIRTILWWSLLSRFYPKALQIYLRCSHPLHYQTRWSGATEYFISPVYALLANSAVFFPWMLTVRLWCFHNIHSGLSVTLYLRGGWGCKITSG